MWLKLLTIAVPVTLFWTVGCVEESPPPPEPPGSSPLDPAPRSDLGRPNNVPESPPPRRAPDPQPDDNAGAGGAPDGASLGEQGLPAYGETPTPAPSSGPGGDASDAQSLGELDLTTEGDQDPLAGRLESDFTLPNQPAGDDASQQAGGGQDEGAE